MHKYYINDEMYLKLGVALLAMDKVMEKLLEIEPTERDVHNCVRYLGTLKPF